MFDSHFHLLRLPNPDEVLQELLKVGYAGESSACTPNEWARHFSLLQGQSAIAAAYGIHPANAHEATPENLQKLEEFLQKDARAAVGECGLDKRFAGYAKGGAQDATLRAQVKLAVKYGRRLVFHIVGDHRRVFQMLRDEGVPAAQQLYFHRFGGDGEAVTAARAFDSTFGNPRRRECVTMVYGNADRIRTETDADERFCDAKTAPQQVAELLVKTLKSAL